MRLVSATKPSASSPVHSPASNLRWSSARRAMCSSALKGLSGITFVIAADLLSWRERGTDQHGACDDGRADEHADRGDGERVAAGPVQAERDPEVREARDLAVQAEDDGLTGDARLLAVRSVPRDVVDGVELGEGALEQAPDELELAFERWSRCGFPRLVEGFEHALGDVRGAGGFDMDRFHGRTSCRMLRKNAAKMSRRPIIPRGWQAVNVLKLSRRDGILAQCSGPLSAYRTRPPAPEQA